MSRRSASPEPDPAPSRSSAARAPAAPDGWTALRTGVVLAPLPAVGGLRVAGADRLDFLHGQLAHDVRGLAVGGARRSLLLDEKGHARAEATVHRRAADVHLAVEDDALAWVEARLRAHVVFDQVDLASLGDRLATLTLQGPRVAELLASLAWPLPAPGAFATVPHGDASLLLSPHARSGEGGVDVHLLRDHEASVTELLLAAGAVATDAATLEPSRIAAGLPRARADAGAGVLPQEADLTDAFSTRKGCYLGQEIMARVEARGSLKRGLAGLRFVGGGPDGRALDATVLARLADASAKEDRALLVDGRRVGLLGSVARHPEHGPIALAVLRHDVAPGTTLDVAAVPGVRARRVALPFPAAR